MLKENINGTTAYDIITTLKNLGFNAYGKKVCFNLLDKELLPFIMHIRKNNLYHYIVVYDINKKSNKVTIMDPAYGIKKVSCDELNQFYTGVILLMYPIKTLPTIKESNEIIKYFINRKLLKIYLLIFIIIIILIILTLINNLYLKFIIDFVIENKSLELLYLSFIIFIGITILKNSLDFFKNKIIININYDIFNKLYFNVIKHYMLLPYEYLNSKSIGDKINRISDINIIKDSVIKIISSLVLNIFIIIIILLVILFINIRLFILLMIFIVILTFLALIFNKLNKNNIKYYMHNNNEIDSFVYECLKNIESIKNINLYKNIFDKINDLNKNNILINKKLFNNINKESILKNSFIDFAYILIIFIIVLNYFTNNYYTVGDIVTLSVIFNVISNCINEIIIVLPELEYFYNASYRINEILKFGKIEYKNNNILFNSNEIKVNNLSISYNNIDYINMNLNFIIKNNSFVFIKGSNGVGKSSFIKILKKYINNYDGDIYISNKNIKDISMEQLNYNIIYVSQKERLFNLTIEENIKINKCNLNNYNFILNITLVKDLINKLTLKDKFLIEEDSFNISGGEKQKIVLARALMNNFSILVLDEALSEVAIEDELTIIDNLKNYYKDKTIIYISHNNKIENKFENIIDFGGINVRKK